ncbi:Transcription factor [Actinoplanes friuliensis DSM 7358]|uniref:Transcription factor n=2 Tax=Actinoplanes friuliensis TaxID=196914 RepID=U5WA86_9ACTN|nr:Transcription factor [Actinoplanes friuliensis DSM 7358]
MIGRPGTSRAATAGTGLVRVGLVDDHPVTLWGLRSALEAAGLSVTATAADTAGLDPDGFDVLLLDLYLGSDLPCLDEIRHWSDRTRVVVMSASERPEDVAQTMAAGARAYVHKGNSAERYVSTVHAAAAGLARAAAPDPAGKLSPRERLVLTGIAGGRTHDQIARQLGISRHTVDTYVKRVRAKMNVGNKAELTRASMALGLGRPG